MRSFIIVLPLLLSFTAAHAESIFKIEIGKDYKAYTQSDLQRRVWELERAVWQLQQRVFQLESDNSKPAAPLETWVCKINAMGNTYTARGATKAVATDAVTEKCKAGNEGDGFFCKSVTCEQ